MYSIVEFKENGNEPTTVEIAPTSWISEEENGALKCQWPPKKGTLDQCKLVQKRMTVDKSWESFTVNRIMQTTDSYDKARKLLRRAVDDSDLQTEGESEIPAKRKRIANSRFTDDMSVSDDEGSNDPTPPESLSVPNPPEVPLSLSTSLVKHNTTSACSTLPKQKLTKERNTEKSNEETSSCFNSPQIPPSAASTPNTCTRVSQLLPSPVERQILARMTAMEVKINNSSNMMKEILKKLSIVAEANVDLPADIDLPVEDIEEMTNLETKLLEGG